MVSSHLLIKKLLKATASLLTLMTFGEYVFCKLTVCDLWSDIDYINAGHKVTSGLIINILRKGPPRLATVDDFGKMSIL